MPKELSAEDVAVIKSAAQASCLNKGIPERIKNPAMRNGTIKNPAFEMCYLKQLEIGMRESRSGRMRDWIRSTQGMIQEQGGLIGLFEKLGFISNQIRNGETVEDNDNASQSGKSDGGENNTGSRSNAMVWIGIALFLVLLIVLIVFLLKKKRDGGAAS